MKTRLIIDEDSVYEIDAGGIIGLNLYRYAKYRIVFKASSESPGRYSVLTCIYRMVLYDQ